MALRFISRERCWWFACELLFLNGILSFTVPRGFVLTAIGDITQCLLLVAVLFCVFPNTRALERRARLFWLHVSLACALWLCAQVLWTYFEVFLRQEVPNPFVGDVILFLHLVPLMGALAIRPHAEREGQASRTGALDFSLLLTWWLYLYLFAVTPWQFISPNSTLYGQSFDLVYVLEHLAFLICAGVTWARSTGSWKTIYGHLFGAGLLYAVGSIAAGVAIDFGRYYTGSVYDVPLIGAMAWFAGMGWIARKLPMRNEPSAGRERPDIWLSGLAMGTILSLPVMAAWALYISQAPLAVRSFRVILTLGMMLLMGTLTWIKQHRLDKELARANRELREDSLTDVLTGARNRRFLTTTIDADIRQVVRSYSPAAPHGKRNRDLAFYLIDTDSFKQVNDRYGHDIGDKLLVEMARRISSAIRHSDALIRWGGDEFLVASRYTNRGDCAVLANRVLNFVGRDPFELDKDVRIHCTCSIGWAVFPWYVLGPEAVPYDEVVRLADYALYQAKKAGRNQAVGLLPNREEPGPSGEIPIVGGKNDRLTEQLSTRAIPTPGPAPKADSRETLVAKAIPATQGT